MLRENIRARIITYVYKQRGSRVRPGAVLWRAIPHKITELVKKTKITPAHWRDFSSLLEISPAYARFLQPTRDFSSPLEISPAYWRNFSSRLEKFLHTM